VHVLRKKILITGHGATIQSSSDTEQFKGADEREWSERVSSKFEME
jgi:hypothetical protein